MTDRPNLSDAATNFGQLSLKNLKKSNINAVMPKQVVTRSGLVTGAKVTKSVAAFRKKAPETTRLTNQLGDIRREKVKATPERVAELKEQLEAAKKAEGVGQAKKGRPPGSKNAKK